MERSKGLRALFGVFLGLLGQLHFVPCEQRPFDLPRLGRSKGLCSQGIHFGDVSETKSRSDHVTRNASAARNNEAY